MKRSTLKSVIISLGLIGLNSCDSFNDKDDSFEKIEYSGRIQNAQVVWGYGTWLDSRHEGSGLFSNDSKIVVKYDDGMKIWGYDKDHDGVLDFVSYEFDMDLVKIRAQAFYDSIRSSLPEGKFKSFEKYKIP